MLRNESKRTVLHLVGQFTGGVQAVHVSLPPPDYLVWNVLTHHTAEGLDDLQDGGSCPCAEVEDMDPLSVLLQDVVNS